VVERALVLSPHRRARRRIFVDAATAATCRKHTEPTSSLTPSLPRARLRTSRQRQSQPRHAAPRHAARASSQPLLALRLRATINRIRQSALDPARTSSRQEAKLHGPQFRSVIHPPLPHLLAPTSSVHLLQRLVRHVQLGATPLGPVVRVQPHERRPEQPHFRSQHVCALALPRRYGYGPDGGVHRQCAW
jgi:hypothetical protein